MSRSMRILITFSLAIACLVPSLRVAGQEQQASSATRNLWITRFTCDAKAASAVAAVQSSDTASLEYSNLFASVKTFETTATQPDGTWTLTAKETDFSGGSAAKRALLGYGSGRAKITMEYTLYDPAKKVVWTQKISTKSNFWGATTLGAAQDQGKAMDAQGQKLVDALTKFFMGGTTEKKK